MRMKQHRVVFISIFYAKTGFHVFPPSQMTSTGCSMLGGPVAEEKGFVWFFFFNFSRFSTLCSRHKQLVKFQSNRSVNDSANKLRKGFVDGRLEFSHFEAIVGCGESDSSQGDGLMVSRIIHTILAASMRQHFKRVSAFKSKFRAFLTKKGRPILGINPANGAWTTHCPFDLCSIPSARRSLWISHTALCLLLSMRLQWLKCSGCGCARR